MMNADGPPRIGLVTVTYQSGGVLKPFLECVERQTMDDLLLVAVDNASDDQTREILSSRATGRTVVQLNNENLGVATGNNQGIRTCLEHGADWILLINNDTEFPPDLCAKLLAVAEEQGCRVLVPAISYHDSPTQMWYSGGDFIWFKGGIQTRHSEKALPATPQLREVAYAPTCCMLVHRSVFEQVGLMDEAYFVYWDDTDFCWRLRQQQQPIHLYTGTVLAHKVSRLTGGQKSPFSIRHYNRNQIYFLRKHFPLLLAAACTIAISGKNLARALLRIDTSAEHRMRRNAIAEGWRMPMPGNQAIKPRDSSSARLFRYPKS